MQLLFSYCVYNMYSLLLIARVAPGNNKQSLINRERPSWLYWPSVHNFAHCTMSPIRPASNCRLSSKAMVQFNERVIRTRDPVTFVVHDSKRISHLFSHLTMSAPGQPSCGQEKWYSAAQNTRVSSDTIQWFICWVQFQVHRNWMHRMSRRLQWNMSINTPTRISWCTLHVLHLKCGHKHMLIIMEEIMFMFLTQIPFFSGWSERMLLP